MKQQNFKLHLAIHIFIILILIGLCFRIYATSLDKDCNKCVIEFKSNRPDFGLVKFVHNINVTSEELIVGYINNECPVFWDKNEGFKRR